jgi:radical SAM enzyme (rSAM/lipoprotein system)
MPLEDFLRVLDENITPNVNPKEVLIIFSGGEVLMRKDLEQAGADVSLRGYPWGIVTNGMALTIERLTSLVDAGLSSISISLDGFADTHNHIRCHEDAFERAVKAITAIAKLENIAFDVITCLTPPMVERLEEFKEWLISLGVKHWRIFSIFPAGRASTDPTLNLSNDEFRTALDFIKRTRKEGRIDVSYACEGFLGEYEAEVRDNFYQCGAGVSVASIRVDGSISGCTSVRGNYTQGNIYKDDFWEVWQNRFEPFRNREWAHKDSCAECDVWRYCKGGGMHLRDNNGELMYCHYHKLK